MSDTKTIGARALIDTETMVRAFKIHAGKRSVFIRVGMGVLGFATIFWAIYAIGQMQFGLAVVLVLIGIGLIVRAAQAGFHLRNSVTKQLRQAGQELQEVNYQICDSYLQTETKEGTSNMEWTKFRKWKESDGLILAYRHDAHFIILPIEQFDETARDAIRSHLVAHVPMA